MHIKVLSPGKRLQTFRGGRSMGWGGPWMAAKTGAAFHTGNITGPERPSTAKTLGVSWKWSRGLCP